MMFAEPRPDIANQRLANRELVKPTLGKASEVVAKLGAVQAQDYGVAAIVERGKRFVACMANDKPT